MNCSTFRLLVFGSLPKVKRGAFRNWKMVATPPLCRKPTPRTWSPNDDAGVARAGRQPEHADLLVGVAQVRAS